MTLEVRWAENQPERYPALVADLVRLPVDVIVAGDTDAAVAAQHATSTIPIVAISFDAVRDGLVASLERPGGNITGLSVMVPELSGKRFELLTEAVPGLARVALLLDAGPPNWQAQLHDHEAAARGLGVPIGGADIDEEGHAGEPRHGLGEQLQPFPAERRDHQAQPREVPSGPRQAGDQPVSHRIETDRDDGNGAGRVLRRHRRGSIPRDEDIHRQPH